MAGQGGIGTLIQGGNEEICRASRTGWVAEVAAWLYVCQSSGEKSTRKEQLKPLTEMSSIAPGIPTSHPG